MSAEGVVAALVKVMADLPAIGKGDKSPEGYSYRGIEAITKHLQPLLARHGVVIVPKASIVNVVPSPAMKDGWQDVYATVSWTIYGPDGSSVEACTNGIGRDRADKGANKAQTQAYKYLLLHLLSIADKADDSDGQTYEHDRAEQVDPERAEAQRVFDELRDLPDASKAAFKAWTKARPFNVPALLDPEWRAQVEAWMHSPAATS